MQVNKNLKQRVLQLILQMRGPTETSSDFPKAIQLSGKACTASPNF